MATPDQLREMLKPRPFQPFLIKLASGESFTVRHPENVSWHAKGPELAVHDDDGFHLVEMLLVEVLEPVKPAADAGGNGA
jgi:hypothetical protein